MFYTLIHIESSSLSGFIFDLFGYNGKSMFYLNFSRHHCYVNLFYVWSFELFSPKCKDL